MYNTHSKGISYSAGFFMLIAFAIAGTIMAALLFQPIWTQMTGKGTDAVTAGLIGPEDSNAMKLGQVIYAIVGFLLPAILTATMLSHQPYKLLGFSGPIKPNQTGMVVVMMLSALVVSFALAYFTKTIPLPAEWKIKADKLEADYMRQVQVIVSMKGVGDYLLALLIMAFLPALCEETLFRGGLQNFLSRSTKQPWIAIIAVSLIFSAVHFSYYGFLTRFFMGAVLGLIYHYSGRLWLCILAHFINNALAVTVVYIGIRQGKPMDTAMEDTGTGWWGILLLPALIGLFYYFRKMTHVNKTENYA